MVSLLNSDCNDGVLNHTVRLLTHRSPVDWGTLEIALGTQRFATEANIFTGWASNFLANLALWVI